MVVLKKEAGCKDELSPGFVLWTSAGWRVKSDAVMPNCVIMEASEENELK